MLKEIEAAEKARNDIETQVIALLEELDQLSVLVKNDEETLKQAKQNFEGEKKIIEEDLETIAGDAVKWEQKHDELCREIPADLLARYEKVKKRNKGVGVISVWKAVCNGCHMNIPPQLYIELQKSSEMFSCPNCNRIIYFKDQEKTS